MARKKNMTPYEAAEYFYSYSAFVNDIPAEEQLEKYRLFAQQYAYDTDAVIDANTKAHKLELEIAAENEKLREEEAEGFAQKIERMKKSNTEWIEYMASSNKASVDEVIGYYDDFKRMYMEMLSEMGESGVLTPEELELMWEDYYSEQRDVELKQTELMRTRMNSENSDSMQYLRDASYFNVWDGDDPVSAYGRVRERNIQNVQNGIMTWDEFSEYMASVGRNMYTERAADSMRWLDYGEKTGTLSEEEYIAGLERVKKYTREYYNEGIISHREYVNAMNELDIMQYEKFDDILSRRKDEIAAVKEEYSALKDALSAEYTEYTLDRDISETSDNLDMFKNAVTQRGKDEYKRLTEQMRRLEYEKEAYELERDMAEEIADVNEKYDIMEENKAALLSVIAEAGTGAENILSSIAYALSSAGKGASQVTNTVNITAADGVTVRDVLKTAMAGF